MSQESFNFLKTASQATPMMKQFFAVKSEYQDCILFYRMGDFYEMFFEDAIEAAKVLNISLTKRGKHENQDIPMCGVPYHSSENYLHKLIEYGFKVAICEQMESPEIAKKRGYKEVVRREVVRVVTPGTILEDNLLDGKSSNYLMSIAFIDNRYAVAWLDISTGEFSTINSTLESLGSDIARLSPKEILISDKLFNDKELSKIFTDWRKVLTPHVASFFDVMRNEKKIKNFYNVATLNSFGELSRSQISACGSILEYVSITQKDNLPKLELPKVLKNEIFMQIDFATRRNLDLIKSSSDNKNNTVLNVIDKTKTNMGGRLLNQYISAPLIDTHAINSRLNLVEFFYNHEHLNKEIRDILEQIPDLERAVSRLNASYGGPRDIAAIKNGLILAMSLAQKIELSGVVQIPHIQSYMSYLGGFDELIDELNRALSDEIPVVARDGGFVRKKYHAKLDELYELRDNSRVALANLKAKYIKETGISNLKLTKNNVLGYFIEVTPQHSDKINSDNFIHRQSLANAVRYTTIELKDLESDIINGKDLILNLEMEVYEYLRKIIIDITSKIQLTCNSIAVIDLSSSLAFVAIKNNYVRPIIDESKEFNIQDGRHIVVEESLKKMSDEEFISNNCALDRSQNIWLLTGPNMAGKSTFLRQNAVIAILAQMGSFVPASFAHIGVIDRVFSRVGAADDLAKGRSTFMVEMIETAIILNQATSRSLVILDEIGRGTSTYDGLSIAWSCLEYLHNKIKSRTIFATHYHELTSLENDLSNLKCFSLAIKEWEGSVIFLHKVIEGAANRSYGIHVAKIAGIPEEVIKRANVMLKSFESKKNDSLKTNILVSNSSNAEPSVNITLVNYLKTVDPNQLTPIEALNHIVKIKQILAS